ncbi:DUF6415 family natural product biosynthesis protein [Streptomyces sp. NPDC048420]|uniref:DUF6415 family natural product biosynthesis protein n=1 Tax=Streptomyces sp. NPDC048420 TaxID=3155755 RepID=UPI00341AA996
MAAESAVASEEDSSAGPPAVSWDAQEMESRVRSWLLLAAYRPACAVMEWQKHGVALLACNTLFAVVRMPAGLVHLVAGTDDPEQVADYLESAVHGGAVFVDSTNEFYYFLLPPSTSGSWESPGVDLLGSDYSIGVPPPEVTAVHADRHRSYWAVPMRSPHSLCSPEAVRQLASHARLLVVQQNGDIDPIACRARCAEALSVTRDVPRELPVRKRVNQLTPVLRDDVEMLVPHVQERIDRIPDEENRKTAQWLLTRARSNLLDGPGSTDLSAAQHLEDLAHVARALMTLVDLAAAPALPVRTAGR